MAVFFTGLLPQFAESFPALLAYGFLFCAMTMCWLDAYAALIASTDDLFRRPGVRRILDSLTGVALVGLGVRLATTDR